MKGGGGERRDPPSPHPLPSTFLLSPNFSRGPNYFFARPEFRSLRTGTLATQAIPKVIDLIMVLECILTGGLKTTVH